MKNVFMLGSLALALVVLPALSAQDEPKTQKRPDPELLAKKLMSQCAGVKDGDLVQISAGLRDVDLLEAMAIEAAKLGADTLLTFSPSDRTMRRLYTDVPAKFDSRIPPLGVKLAETITVSINVDSSETDAVLAGLPPERRSAKAEAGAKIFETMLKRNVRQVWLGNGLYPTDTRAKELGLDKAALAKLFYAGLDADYDKLQATGEAVRQILTGGKKVHISTPDGTDLTVEIATRPVYVSDGVLSDAKIKQGGAACQMWLPAGEVYVTPVAGTAEGTVVVDRQLWEGKEVRGLRMTFKKGKMIDMKAKSGMERLQAMYDAASAGKDEFSALDIGINPAVRLPSSSPTGLYMEAGSIAVNVGNNVWAGGDNKCSYGVGLFLRGGTLHVDGKAMVQDGTLQIGR